MGTNPGDWLSGLGPTSVIIYLLVCLLAVLAIRSIFAAIHKYDIQEGEIRFGLLRISVRWSRKPQDELNPSDPEDDETSGESSKPESQEDETPPSGGGAP